jgi:FAD:protein FMN transferase
MEKRLIEKKFYALGTDIVIKLIIKEQNKSSERVLDDIEKFYREKEKIMSRFDSKSELSRLNNNLNSFQKTENDIVQLAKSSLEYYDLSGGIFDPRIIEALEQAGYDRSFKTVESQKEISSLPMEKISNSLKDDLEIQENTIIFRKRMDFSGIAKGYITDFAATFLKKRGWKNFLIDSGGDIFAGGGDENDEEWKISVEGIPEEKIIFRISEKGIATSGISRRKWEIDGKKFHHLINPQEPKKFDFNLQTVTVVSETTENSDVWAKVFFILGREQGIKISNEKKIACLFLDNRGDIYISEEMKKVLI